MLSYQIDKGVSQVSLKGEMTIYTAGELLPQLREAVDAAPEVEIDLGQVTDLDTAGLQLLMLAKKQSPEDTRVRLINHSQPVVDVIELMNLAGYFNDPIVLSGQTGTAR